MQMLRSACLKTFRVVNIPASFLWFNNTNAFKIFEYKCVNLISWRLYFANKSAFFFLNASLFCVAGVVPEQTSQVAQSRTTEGGAEEEGRARQKQAASLRKISQW